MSMNKEHEMAMGQAEAFSKKDEDAMGAMLADVEVDCSGTEHGANSRT